MKEVPKPSIFRFTKINWVKYQSLTQLSRKLTGLKTLMLTIISTKSTRSPNPPIISTKRNNKSLSKSSIKIQLTNYNTILEVEPTKALVQEVDIRIPFSNSITVGATIETQKLKEYIETHTVVSNFFISFPLPSSQNQTEEERKKKGEVIITRAGFGSVDFKEND